MVQRTRGRGEVIPRADEVLQAMVQCRKVLLAAQSGVRLFRSSWHAMAIVTAAIDTLALFMTGRPDFYPIGGSIPVSRGPMP